MSALAPSALKRLQAAYDSYMAARYPNLNSSAEELAKVAKELGWVPDLYGRPGVKVWTEKMLGITP